MNEKDRSEVYSLKGPIKGKIWGDSPDECCSRIYFLPKLTKESSTTKTLPTSSSDSTTASSGFDGRYRFTVYRYNENDGAMMMGAGDIEIKNGEMILDSDNSYLSTGPKDLYGTFEGQIDEKGNVSGSVELAYLFGKDHSDVFTLSGQIDKKIWGDNPRDDFFRVYMILVKK